MAGTHKSEPFRFTRLEMAWKMLLQRGAAVTADHKLQNGQGEVGNNKNMGVGVEKRKEIKKS
jgi:hypothetical protein